MAELMVKANTGFAVALYHSLSGLTVRIDRASGEEGWRGD
jgi:hypothetical protein